MFTNHTLKIAGFHVTVKYFRRELHFGPRLPKLDLDEDGVCKFEKDTGGLKSRPAPPKSAEAIEIANYRRAQDCVVDLINANIIEGIHRPGNLTAKFFTMTYKDEVQAEDTPRAIKDFTSYIKKVNWNYFGKKTGQLKYVAVMELQPKSKKIHFHTVLFNHPWIEQKKLQDLWGYGIVDIRKIYDRNYGQYMAKYLGKNFREYHEAGKKHYFRSRGLVEAQILRHDGAVLDIINNLPDSLVLHKVENIKFPIWNGFEFVEQVMDKTDYSLKGFPEVVDWIQQTITNEQQHPQPLRFSIDPINETSDMPVDYDLGF